MLKKLCLTLLLGLLSTSTFAQVVVGGGGTSTGTGSADPSQFSSSTGTLTIGGSVGAVTIDADTSVIPTYATGTSLPATCTPFATSFLDTDSTTTLAYDCIATDLWAGRFTIADDAVLVGTGTTTASKAIPDCDDSAGQHLNYDTTTNAFSCGTSGGSSFDPSTTLQVYCDFLAGLSTAGNLGECGWGFLAISAGTVSQPAGLASNPGLVRLSSHATNDNSGIMMQPNANTGAGVLNATWTAKDWSYDGVVVLGSNSTAITNIGFYFGLMSGTNSDPATQTGGVWIRYNSDNADATFIFAICNSATAGCGSAGDDTAQKTVASTVTPSAGTAYRFRIRRATSGVGGNPTIYMRVNNETEKTFCSSGCDDTLGTLGLNNWFPGVAYLTRTTTGVLSGDVDYLYVNIPGLARY